MKPLLELGYVSAAHGIRGELTIKPFDVASETLFEVERLVLRLRGSTTEETHTIESIRATPKGFLMALEEVTTREGAEALVGATVLVFREDLEEPAEGEFFQGDLIGLTAVDEQGKVLGRVEELWETGPVPNLVIRGPETPELAVPFVDEFVPSVDLAAGRVVIRPPEYEE